MTDVEQSFPSRAGGDTAQRKSRLPRLGHPAFAWRASAAFQSSAVMRTLTDRLVPRFLHARPADQVAASTQVQPIDPVVSFAAMTLLADASTASDFIDELLARGASIESVYLDWLAPAARVLGAQWETDETDFANVTLGTSCLHRIMRRHGDDFCAVRRAPDTGLSALLTVVPGEQHTFGLSMVAEFFRRAGWTMTMGPLRSTQELEALVRADWFDMVGFAVSSNRRLSDLKREIETVRAASRNRNVAVMLGGPMLAAHPELVAALGADMMSIDAATAPQSARSLIDTITGRA